MIFSKETVLVFDFDGTIVETEKQVLGIMNGFRQRFGLKKIEVEDFRKTGSSLSIFHYKFVRFLSSFVVQFVQKEQAKNLNRMIVEPGLIQVIRTLANRNYTLGIVSSNSLENVHHYLKFHHLSALFNFVYVSDNLFDKGEVIREMIDSQKLDRSHVVYIGDETRDVEAAKDAGVRVVAVTWGYQSREAFLHAYPDWLIDHPRELLHLFVPLPWWKKIFLKLFSTSAL